MSEARKLRKVPAKYQCSIVSHTSPFDESANLINRQNFHPPRISYLVVAMFAVQHTSSPSSILGAAIGLEALPRPLDTTTTSNPISHERHESQWRNGHMTLQEMEEKS